MLYAIFKNDSQFNVSQDSVNSINPILTNVSLTGQGIKLRPS